MIDLASDAFWLFSALAVAILTPLAWPRLRRAAWAGINLGFLAYLLQRDVALVALVLALGWLALKAVERGGALRTLGLLASLGGMLHLLIQHEFLQPTGGPAILAVIGFSYVWLRWIEVIRAVASRRHPCPTPMDWVSYLLPFHMLAAGPIQAYDEFVAQPAAPPPLDAVDVLEALERIGFGLFKKFVVCFVLDELFLTDFRARGLYLVLEIQAFYLWFYLEFSAYSDVAVGLGRLLGIATPENFNHPYRARNMIEFWERWHISLSQWIRRNLFIPIQLNLARRTGGKRLTLISTVAFSVSFILCGLWHEPSLPFLAWGGMHALGLVVTNLYRDWLTRRHGKKWLKTYLAKPAPRWIGRVLTFEWVALSLLVIEIPW